MKSYPSTYFNDGRISWRVLNRSTSLLILWEQSSGYTSALRRNQKPIDKSAGEVSRHFCEQVHVEVSDVAIFVEGEKGKVTILIEQLK